MRIALLPSSYPPVLGGLQTAVHSLASGLIAAGHDVQVFTNRYPRTLPSVERVDTVSVGRYLFLYPRWSYLKRLRPDLFLAGWYYLPITLFNLRRALQAFAPDVVNVHYPTSQNLFVLWLRKRFPFRLVVSLHGYEVEGYDQGTPAERGYLKKILQTADAVTACSQNLLAKAFQIEASLEAKSQVIYNGIAVERFKSLTASATVQPYLLALGRYTKEKGFDLLLEAFARVQDRLSDLILILAGEGEERLALQSQATRLALGDRLRFYGRATATQVEALVAGCACVIIPSRRETFGMVALEAMAAGKPVIATRVGGLPEVVIGRGNWLVEPTIDGLAAALLEWSQARSEMDGSENKQRAALFSTDVMVKNYLRVYQAAD